MNTYKVLVSYDGTDFYGWIQQPNKPSIVQTITDTFYRTFGTQLSILGASKTDAGVHAFGQVALLKTAQDIAPEKLQFALNNALPSSISLRNLEYAYGFHPHHNVLGKNYWYHIAQHKPLGPYARWIVQVPPYDMDRLQQALTLFQGKHDMSAFYTGNDRTDTIRTIDRIRVLYMHEYDCYRIEIKGHSFLRHMVRRIVGACLAYASRADMPLHSLKTALEEQKMVHELPTAPAKGLTLAHIEYKE